MNWSKGAYSQPVVPLIALELPGLKLLTQDPPMRDTTLTIPPRLICGCAFGLVARADPGSSKAVHATAATTARIATFRRFVDLICSLLTDVSATPAAASV